MTDASPSLIGQQPVLDALAKVAGHKVAYGHAYLLSGADTVAVTALASWFRAYLGCSAPVGVTPCGHCPSCTSGAHEDGVWSLWLGLETGEHAHSVERIRSLRQFTALKPVGNGRRVVVVESADTLRGAAANALLKSVEEPTANLVYILTAQHYSAVLPTIRSRAMSVVVQAVPQALLVRELVKAGHTRSAAEFAASLYPGQAGRAAQLLDQPERFDKLHALDRAMATWPELSVAQRLQSASAVLDGYSETSAQRQRVLDALTVAARSQRHGSALRALLHACLGLRTNAQPKLIFDAFALQTL